MDFSCSVVLSNIGTGFCCQAMLSSLESMKCVFCHFIERICFSPCKIIERRVLGCFGWKLEPSPSRNL